MTVDELADYGVERMDEEAMRGLLASQHHGVLGLPTGGAPYMLPMSYAFDGESALYFVYVVGADSQKDALSRRSDRARFLVYSAETAFNWRSVLAAGRLRDVPEGERASLERDLDIPWRPDVFERAGADEATRLYRFAVEDWSGLKHTGLPAAFDE